MFYNPAALLVGAAAIFSSFAAAADCANGPWQDVQYVGGKDGSEFCFTKWDQGIVMTGLEAWATMDEIQGIQFYYSDGTTSGMVGKLKETTTKHARIDWDPATDGVEQLKTWGNGIGTLLGRVYLRTKAGAEFDVGKEDTSGQDVFESKTASGILLGAFGRSGWLIDGVGFLFMKSKIDKMTIEDVSFDETPEELNKRMQGLQTVVLDYADHTNNAAISNETFTFTKSTSRKTSKKYTTAAEHSFGFSNAMEVSGEILDLGVKDTLTLSYGYKNTKTEESSTEKDVTLAYSVATFLRPGQRIFCKATAMSGQYKGDYTSTVHVWLEDGTDFTFIEKGEMEQVAWSQASSICQDDPFTISSDIGSSKRAVKFIA